MKTVIARGAKTATGVRYGVLAMLFVTAVIKHVARLNSIVLFRAIAHK